MVHLDEEAIEQLGKADPDADYCFRCNYCIKFIGPERPVYMRHDCSFCSTSCRRRGRSRLFWNLRGMQLDRMREPADSVYSEMTTAMSDSSLGSLRGNGERIQRGPLGWVIVKVFDAISSRFTQPLVQAASSVLLGRLRKNSSLGRLLDYLPEDHTYFSMREDPSSSEMSDATFTNCS